MDATITREQAAAIANLVATFRPEWNLRLTTDEVMKCRGPLAAISDHALAVASDWANKAPTRISQIPMATRGGGTDKAGDKAPCQWCHRTEYACRQAQRNTGLDPHAYRPLSGARVPASANGWRSGDSEPRTLPGV